MGTRFYSGDQPLNALLVTVEATRELWHLGVHKIHDLFQVVFPTTQVRFADFVFAFSSGSTTHLSEHRGTDKVATHSRIVKNYTASRPY